MRPSSVPIALFRLGRLVATQNALEVIPFKEITNSISRHQSGDWGNVPEDDRSANYQALEKGGRLFSVYHSVDGVRFYLITEADRSVTTVLLPSDY